MTMQSCHDLENGTYQIMLVGLCLFLFVCLVALRPKSTAVTCN